MNTFGYARVSRAKQDVEKQRQFLEGYGCTEIILETASGKNDKRKEFNKLLGRLEPGDTVIVRQLDRLSRRTVTLLQIRDKFEKQGVKLVADGKTYDFTVYTDRMLYGVQAVMAEYESDLNGERVKAAVSVRKKKEGYGNVGRPSALTPRKKLEVYKAMESGASKSSLAARYNVARSTVTKAYEEIQARRAARLSREAHNEDNNL